MKTLKRDFGNPLIVAHSRLSSVFDKPQIKANYRISLHQFHQQLKCNNSFLLSIGLKSPIFSSENLTKAIHHLPLHLRNWFYKFTKDSNLMDGSVNLLIFEKWLDGQIKVYFNPLADIVNKQDLSNKSKPPLSNSYSRLTINSLDISEEIQDEKEQGLKSSSNSIVKNSNKSTESVGFKCWCCRNNCQLKDCKRFSSKLVSDRKQFIKEHKLCWKCLSKKHSKGM